MAKKTEKQAVDSEPRLTLADRIKNATKSASGWSEVHRDEVEMVCGGAVRLASGLFANLATGTCSSIGLQPGQEITGLVYTSQDTKEGVLYTKRTLFIEEINGLSDWGSMTTTDDNRQDREL